MSSFPRDISAKIQHSLAEFSVSDVNSGNRDLLGPEASWLYDYAYRNVPTGGVPMRADLEPNDMKHLLPDVMILEPEIENGSLADIKIRLAGSRMTSFYGPVSGASLRSLNNATVVDRGFKCVAAVLTSGQPVLGHSVKMSADLPYFQVTLLFIPLVDENGKIDQIFAHFSAAPERD
ncbi:PAS domain-containing protein [Kordiimonas lacus]|uniref:PAS domain-containing protein n=1 Tax=Kordiimonas lacus TaxID=637679 RepID=A0A1G6WRC5_9PROT|nr:PAS domain-containing protein [Kordiimonas lacus]SDD68213.1 PAS domain-containing protein [Kordiimonas lacus]